MLAILLTTFARLAGLLSPVTRVLTVLSGVLRYWKLIAAVVSVFGLGIALEVAHLDGYKKRVKEDAQAQVVAVQKRLLAANMAAAQEEKRAKEDADKITQLETLANATPKNDGGCLSPDAARRVRAIRGTKPVAAPLSSRRISNVLPGRLGRP
jgi:hypothetical protein